MPTSNDPRSPGPLVAPAGDVWVGLTEHPLPRAAAEDWAVLPACGAMSMFYGVVRDHNEGREGVTRIDYESYPGQAERVLGEVAGLAREYWPEVGRIAVLHRTGAVALGEASVVCCVSAPHRHDAIEAMTFCIDVLKASAPIWKTEYASDGTAWPDNGSLIQSVSDAANAWWDDRGIWPAIVEDGVVT